MVARARAKLLRGSSHPPGSSACRSDQVFQVLSDVLHNGGIEGRRLSVGKMSREQGKRETEMMRYDRRCDS